MRTYSERSAYENLRAVSQSELKVLQRSPRRYEAQYITKTLQIEPSDAMEFGSLVHTMTLQPHLVNEQYVSIPSDVLTSNGQRRGKAWEQFVSDNHDKTPVRESDFRRASTIAESVWQHPFFQLASEWVEHVEKPIAWIDPDAEVACKGIPDIVCSNEWIIDLKTTNDLTGFLQGQDVLTSSKIAEFGYHIQAAFYLRGATQFYDSPKTRFALLVVETQLPHRVYAIELNQAAIFAGEGTMVRLLREYKLRTESNDWSEEGENNLLQVGLPSWAS